MRERKEREREKRNEIEVESNTQYLLEVKAPCVNKDALAVANFLSRLFNDIASLFFGPLSATGGESLYEKKGRRNFRTVRKLIDQQSIFSLAFVKNLQCAH